MNLAVIKAGGQQHLVTEGQELLIDLLPQGAKKTLQFDALLTATDKAVKVGTPLVKGATVTAEVIDNQVKGDKLRIIKFKAKKRVHKTTGHRQSYTRIKVSKITQ